jgi:hypothetical protein
MAIPRHPGPAARHLTDSNTQTTEPNKIIPNKAVVHPADRV